MADDSESTKSTVIIKSGWMRKRSNKLNLWADRYFVLKETTLSYYLKPKDLDPKNTLKLHPSCRVSEIRSDVTKKRKQFLFKVVWPTEEEIEEDAKRRAAASSSSSWSLYSAVSAGYNSVMGPSTTPTVCFSSTPRDGERILILACEKYIDAEKWVHALQIRIHMSANVTNNITATSTDIDIARLYAPPPDVRLTDVEEWVKSAKWRVYNVIHGLRILELANDSQLIENCNNNNRKANRTNGLPCLRTNVFLGCSAADVFETIMNYPSGCRTGAIKSVRVIEYIDNATDIIHIVLHPIYVYPTWTAPRDFCLIRYWRQNMDGSHIVCMDSTVHTDCPLVVGCVRGELHAAYIVSPQKDSTAGDEEEHTECMLSFIAQMDAKGWIWNSFGYPYCMAEALMLHVLDIRDTIDVQRFVQAHFDPTNEDRIATPASQVGGVVQQGTIGTIPPPLLSPEVWGDIDASTFRVRGTSYHIDKVKEMSAPSLFKLIAVDLYEVVDATPNICAHPKNRVYLARERNDPAWVFVLNIMVPGPPNLSFVVYLQGDPALIEQDTPFGRVAKRFFRGNDDEFRNNRFKLIPKIIDGNMVIKMAVKDTPTLLGNKLKCYYHKGDNYFEIDVDVGSSSIARNVTGLAMGYSKAIVVDLGMCLQGDEEDELPEVLFGGCTAIHVDCSKAKKL